MLIIAGVLLMIVVSWPFLKLWLIGNRQRVRLIDMLLLGISSLLVLSVGTLYLLDSYAYTRLKAHIHDGLKTLSEGIRSNMRREIAAAYSQLRVLQSASSAETGAGPRIVVDALQRTPKLDFSFYPFFEAYSLIDSKGFQQQKWSIRSRSQSPPRIPVSDREYFTRIVENQTWSLPPEGGLPEIKDFALESIRSITRMDTQAVLAVHNDSPADLPVATLAFPMISLIKPVVPEGFGFAVIEDRDDGRVLFHSDDRRNLIEQFFLETDRDRRLRSVVAARRAELMDLRYWGRDYSAYVAPLAGFPWSVVTFYEKDRVRSVNVDWMLTTLLFLIPYMLGCVFLCLLILIFPQRRATWLWPHPRGLTAYLQLAVFYVALIVLFGAGIYVAGREPGGMRMPDWLLIPIAFLFPTLAWLGTYFRLRAARRAAPIAGDESAGAALTGGERTWAEPNKLLSWSYRGAAALLLVITAAMPTTAFFKLAHSIQVEPYIKYQQVKLVEGLEERRERVEKEASSLSEASKGLVSSLRTAIDRTQLQVEDGKGRVQVAPVDIYLQPFDTNIRPLSAATDGRAGRAGRSQSTDPLPEFLEAYLPYYSELSVERRELLHDRANDESRSWERASGNRIVLTSTGCRGMVLQVSSVVPTFGGLPALFKGNRLGLILVSCAILGLALAIAFFAARRVFLLDIPFWSSGSGGFAAPGQNLFVVCRRPDVKSAYVAGRQFEKLDLSALAGAGAKREDWDSALSGLEKALTGEPIVLDRFEVGSGEGGLSAKKLWLVEQLVGIRHRRLIILSAIGPVPLQHAGLPTEPASKTEEGPSVEQKWASLLTSSFAVIDLDPRFETDTVGATSAPGRMTKMAQVLGGGWRAMFKNFPGWIKVLQHREVRRILDRECAGNPYLSSIHDDLERMIRRRGDEGLDREEVLTEIEERASNYYEGLWVCCSPVEKLALEHLAEDGFANYRDAKIVRSLITRGLVRRDPHLRLMNETFRRFVISTVRRNEIAQLEQDTRASAWDHFKRPFVTILTLVLVLFVATQKERFDAAMALILGATGVLPSLLHLAGMIVGEKSPLAEKPD
ncbi:MAG TPA: cache domain-containing protein, partial [Thermoanaerobaculia bacterium]|nr:cache domain-containing protein [Thermoanaerobaculia bacterium]